jgi:hypothetical protein
LARIASDDFGVDAEGGGVFDKLILEALIEPGLGYRGMDGLGLVDRSHAGGVLGDGGGEYDDGEQEAAHVRDDR